MATPLAISLLSNASATGASQQWTGGKAAFVAEATWGGGTVKLQQMSPNGTWIDVPSSSLTANGWAVVELPPGQVRANVATATAVFASLVSIPR